MKTNGSDNHADSAVHEAWLARSLALLDASTEALDAATLSRLNRARQLAAMQRRALPRVWMLGGGAAAAAVAMLLLVGVTARHSGMPSAPLGAIDDGTDVIASTDDLDLYENLDFYEWLDQQQGDNG